jgi:hypothetical protein
VKAINATVALDQYSLILESSSMNIAGKLEAVNAVKEQAKRPDDVFAQLLTKMEPQMVEP